MAASAHAPSDQDRINALERENVHLRILAATVGCPYGHRTVGGSCELGYPGCFCAADLQALQTWAPENEEKIAARLSKRLAASELKFGNAADRMDELAAAAQALASKLRYKLSAEEPLLEPEDQGATT